MPLFPHAQGFQINGGDFSEVNGNQNHYYRNTNPLHVHGDNNSTTFVDGPYHNGPDNSISNEAGGDMHIIGQGEDCQVNMGPMDDMFPSLVAPSRPSTRQHNTRTPVARSNASNHQRSNNGISNRAGGNLSVVGQGRGSRVQLANNAHLAQQPLRTRNVMYPPIQEYGVEGGYSSQNLHPSQSQYGANFQHQMRSQHPKGWCDPPMEYFPESPVEGTFNPIASPSPPPEYGWANPPPQMTGYPSNNYKYGHHRNVPYLPPARYPPPTGPPAASHQYTWNTPLPGVLPSPQIRYPPPTSPPPSQAMSYMTESDQYMEYHATPHPGLSSSSPVPQLPTTMYPSDNNQYAPYESRPSISLATTTSAPPPPSLPSEPVRVPAPALAPSAPISVSVVPQSHQILLTTTHTPSKAPVEQGSGIQKSAMVGVLTPAIVLSPAGIKDTPPLLLPIDTVPVAHSNRLRQEEQSPLAAPRPLVGGALTNILNPMPAAPSSAPPSANQALLSLATQRVERQDALMPPSISPVSACTLVEELVPAKPEETPARVGNGGINSDSNSSNAIVTENAVPGSLKIVPISQQVLLEQADTSSRTEIPNDNLITKSKPKAKKWRRLVKFIKRQAKKFRKAKE
ncbi:hypothetical protein Agabi119p4_21 [Agaricus bisporus var. burnettii]|uniref:Uncharacterized protein n=1 Tax=Agaricus bisporus var. burnettii TaxID=192524 RepID=A0A8H7F9Z1_AGABI|nr:hypothetical protein Agabi119p4_21 [Agaricus bisporus var. burnettii]